MAFDYESSSALATRMIKKYGRDVTLRRIVDVAPADPDKPWVVADPDTTDVSVTAVFVPIDSGEGSADKTTQTLLSTREEDVCIIDGASLSVEPNVKDQIIDGLLTWVVERIRFLRPGPTHLLYELTLRRG